MSLERSTRREFLQCGCLAVGLGLRAGSLQALSVATANAPASGLERSYPIPAADGVSVDREALVILARYEGRIAAFSLVCPHQSAAIRWIQQDGRFQCTKHDSRFGPEGVKLTGVAPRNLDRRPIRREGESVIVGLDRLFRSDTDPADWASAFVEV